jgi:hypothetical protein
MVAASSAVIWRYVLGFVPPAAEQAVSIRAERKRGSSFFMEVSFRVGGRDIIA